MPGVSFTHRECVGLLQPEGFPRCGLVAIDGRTPIPLACFPLAGGDVLIPAAEDGLLVRMAAWRPVSIEFAGDDPAGFQRWTVRGFGLARPVHDLGDPQPLPRAVRLAVSGRCGAGVRVAMARLHGFGAEPAADVPVQGSGRSAVWVKCGGAEAAVPGDGARARPGSISSTTDLPPVRPAQFQDRT